MLVIRKRMTAAANRNNLQRVNKKVTSVQIQPNFMRFSKKNVESVTDRQADGQAKTTSF